MTVRRFFIVQCDSCDAELGKVPHEHTGPRPKWMHDNERKAARTATAFGWYVDGVRWNDKTGQRHNGRWRCPLYHPGWKRNQPDTDEQPTTEEPTP